MIRAERSETPAWIRLNRRKQSPSQFEDLYTSLKNTYRFFQPCGALAWRKVKVETSVDEGWIILASALYGHLSKVSRKQISDAHLGLRSFRLQWLQMKLWKVTSPWNKSTIWFLEQKTLPNVFVSNSVVCHPETPALWLCKARIAEICWSKLLFRSPRPCHFFAYASSASGCLSWDICGARRAGFGTHINICRS